MSIFDELYDQKTLEEKLHEAIVENALDRAFDLVNAGTDLAALNGWDWTMLQNCISYEMVELLILHDADPDQVDGKGKTIWMNGASDINELVARAQVVRDRLALAATTPVPTGES